MPALPFPAAPPSSMQQLLLERLGSAVPAPVPAPAATAENQALYAEGLRAAAAISAHSLAARTVDQQEAAGRELAAWLGRVGTGRTLLTCTPDDLVAYLAGTWLGAHSGRGGPGTRPKANTLNTVVGNLSGLFARLGRGDGWDASRAAGNPCGAYVVTAFKRGFQHDPAAPAGGEDSAVPLTLGKYRAVCEYLCAELDRGSDGFRRLLLLRDLACMQYMWATSMRGHDTGKLTLTDFRDPSSPGRPFAFPLSMPRGGQPFPPGFSLRVEELGTKTCQGARAPPIILFPGPETRLCFVHTLARYLDECSTAGCFPTKYLFRPSAGLTFTDAPLSSPALCSRVRLHFEQAGVYDGETSHSFRRGALQLAAANGADRAALMRLGQIQAGSTLDRYLDPDRHHGRSGGRKRAPEAGSL